jgi:hypothetical protein
MTPPPRSRARGYRHKRPRATRSTVCVDSRGMPSAGASAIITTNTNRREVEPLQASAVGPVRAAVPSGC